MYSHVISLRHFLSFINSQFNYHTAATQGSLVKLRTTTITATASIKTSPSALTSGTTTITTTTTTTTNSTTTTTTNNNNT